MLSTLKAHGRRCAVREQQRAELTERVAGILDEPAPHCDDLYASQVLFGATHAEMVEILDNLDHVVAREYEDAYGVRV